MLKHINREHLGRNLAAVMAVIIVAFLCGWSAMGLTGGVVFALALGAVTAASVLRENRTDCSPRRVGRRRTARPK
jgi:hypothetical protein